MIRLHVTAPLAAGARLAPDPDQARYLTTVMRLKPGDAVLLFNGRDGEWRASLVEVSKRGCVLEALERTRAHVGTPDLELVVALIKRARLETIVEKATELGCRRIRLVTTRRTNADHTKVERLQAIATEAAEQTGRLDVPEVVAPMKLERLLDAWDAGRRLMFCDEGEGFQAIDNEAGRDSGGEPGSSSPIHGGSTPEVGVGGSANVGAAPSDPSGATSPASRGGAAVAPALDALRNVGGGPWSVLIGPEGGFDPSERQRLRSEPFVTAVSLGPRILRADTATISALTLWQAALGDWRDGA